MTWFTTAYSYIVFTLGAIAALTSMCGGVFCAILFLGGAPTRTDYDNLIGRVGAAIFVLAGACLGAITSLAFTKWVLGL